MKNRLYIPILCVIIGLASCNKPSSEETIIFVGNQGIPNITKYIPDTLLRAFGNSNLNFGDMPPLIDKQFIANDNQHDDMMEIIWSNYASYPVGSSSPNIIFHHMFYKQHNAIAKYRFKSFGVESEVDSVYIMGNAPYFTAYFRETRINSMQSKPRHAVVISGKVGDQGIINYRYGYIIESYETPNSYEAPVGTIVIYQETDTIAYYMDWFAQDSLPASTPSPTPSSKPQTRTAKKELNE